MAISIILINKMTIIKKTIKSIKDVIWQNKDLHFNIIISFINLKFL